MSEKTGIAWCDSTWSPWWGCVEVSPECANCYARELDAKYGGKTKPHWGASGPRRLMSDGHWKQAEAWDRAGWKTGNRKRVFPSMCDPFEKHPALDVERERFWQLVDRGGIVWLLLTKRPENVLVMVPHEWLQSWPENVHLGFTAGAQRQFDERWPYVREIPARVLFLSYEPALGPIDISEATRGWYAEAQHDCHGDDEACARRCPIEVQVESRCLSQVIVGGESGPKRREMDLSWLESIARQCDEAKVALFVKQDSHLYPGRQGRIPDALFARKEFPA